MFTKIASGLAVFGMLIGLLMLGVGIASLLAPSMGQPMGQLIDKGLMLFIPSVIVGVLVEISEYLEEIYENLKSDKSE